MARKLSDQQVQYVVWQNRSLRFYLAGRLLYIHELWSPAAFCGQQAIEALLKATLVYWDKSFRPENARHRWRTMINSLKNKVPGSVTVEIPEYFYAGGRFQSVTRYPHQGRGVGIPRSFLDDLDRTFCDFMRLVPFQFNTELVNLLDGRGQVSYLNALRRKNAQMRRIRRLLRPWMRPRR